MSLLELGTAVILVEEGCLFLGHVKSPSSVAMIHLPPGSYSGSREGLGSPNPIRYVFGGTPIRNLHDDTTKLVGPKLVVEKLEGEKIYCIYIYANQIGSGNPRVQGLKNFCKPTSRHPFLAHLKSHAVLARSQIYTIPSHMFPRITFAKRKLCKVHFRDSQSTSPKIQHRMSQHLDPPTYFFGNGDPFR